MPVRRTGVRRGFTLIELMVALLLSSIVFAGVASLLASAFHSEIQSLRQEVLQSEGNATMKLLERDVERATYLSVPGPGASNNTKLVGYINCVCTGAGSPCPSWDINTTTQNAQRFSFQVCNTNELRYWLEDYGAASAATCSTISASALPGCGSTPTAYLVKNPVQLTQISVSTPIFSQSSASTDIECCDQNNQVDVAFLLTEPATPGNPTINFEMRTHLTSEVSGIAP